MLFLKFVLVGILNTIFGYCVWASMIYFGLHYALSSILALFIGLLFNFKTTGKIVFKNKDNSLILKFIEVNIFITLVSILCLKIAKTIGLNMYLSGFVLTIIFAVVNFLLQKTYVFKRNQ